MYSSAHLLRAWLESVWDDLRLGRHGDDESLARSFAAERRLRPRIVKEESKIGDRSGTIPKIVGGDTNITIRVNVSISDDFHSPNRGHLDLGTGVEPFIEVPAQDEGGDYCGVSGDS